MMKIQFTKGQIEKLLETYGINDIDNILKEDVGSSIIARLLGRKLVTKLEAAYGDDAVRILDNLFAAAESRSGNIITGVDKKLYVVSASGKKWSMETIKKVIDGVASGKLPEDSLDLLPKTLKDGQEFRKIFQNQFKYGKPKPVAPKPTTPKPKPSTTSTTTNPFNNPNGTANVSQETKDTFVSMMNKRGIKINPKQLDDVISEVQKSVNVEVRKVDKLFTDPQFTKFLEKFNELPLKEQNEIVLKSIQSIKDTFGTNLLGMNISTKAKSRYQSLYNAAVDKYYLGLKKRGEKFDLGGFFKWYSASIFTTWGLFMASIYVESMRLDDEETAGSLKFAWEKLKQTPDRFLFSLIPGVNLIGSSATVVYQTFVSAIVLSYRKIKGAMLGTEPKPTFKQKIKTAVKDLDSTYKTDYKPTVDSLSNIYKPKLDSVLQKAKTDYQNNDQPLTGDNRPVIKY